jgi:hypothetical protein
VCLGRVDRRPVIQADAGFIRTAPVHRHRAMMLHRVRAAMRALLGPVGMLFAGSGPGMMGPLSMGLHRLRDVRTAPQDAKD